LACFVAKKEGFLLSSHQGRILSDAVKERGLSQEREAQRIKKKGKLPLETLLPFGHARPKGGKKWGILSWGQGVWGERLL